MTEEICEICGMRGWHEPCNTALAAAELCQRELDQMMLAKYAKYGGLGLQSEQSRESYARVRMKLEAYLKRPLESAAEFALEGNGWWFIPEGWIGMLGYVIETESEALYPLGSGLHALYGRSGYHVPWGAIDAYLDGRIEPVHEK